MSDHITDLIGWGATLILLLTISSQVYEQWRSRSTQGVSHWLFAGQLAASTGFVAYSVLQGDWVFVVSNVFLLFTALLGQVLYLRNRRRQQRVTHESRMILAPCRSSILTSVIGAV